MRCYSDENMVFNVFCIIFFSGFNYYTLYILYNKYYGPSSLFRVVKSIIKKRERETAYIKCQMMKMHFNKGHKQTHTHREREKTDVLLNGR